MFLKRLLILVSLMVFQFKVQAQTAIAKIKYEQAEESFVANDFATAVVKLDEAEKILGSTNPKIMYLRIVCQAKILEQNPEGNYPLIATAKKNTKYYLTKYENLENNEDKYRDIYRISEDLEKYPRSQAEFEVFLSGKKAARLENEKKAALKEKIKSWNATLGGVKIGMKQDEVPSYVLSALPTRFEFKSGQYGVDRDCVSYGQKTKGIKLRYREGLQFLYFDKKDNTLCSITYLHMNGGKTDFNRGEEIYNRISRKMLSHFGADFAKEETTETSVDKTKIITRTTSVDMGNNLVYGVTITEINYGGVLGNDMSVSENYSVMKFNNR